LPSTAKYYILKTAVILLKLNKKLIFV